MSSRLEQTTYYSLSHQFIKFDTAILFFLTGCTIFYLLSNQFRNPNLLFDLIFCLQSHQSKSESPLSYLSRLVVWLDFLPPVPPLYLGWSHQSLSDDLHNWKRKFYITLSFGQTSLNRVDPDQMPQNVASDQGLHCFNLSSNFKHNDRQ